MRSNLLICVNRIFHTLPWPMTTSLIYKMTGLIAAIPTFYIMLEVHVYLVKDEVYQ